MKKDRVRLIWMLRLVGIAALFAFGAAIMPEKWMVETAEFLGFEPFPDSPLTFYLARNLSLLYGFVGVLLMVVANDVDRYLPLIRILAYCTIAFGISQAVVDTMSGLPRWWIVGESLSTTMGGLVMGWFAGRNR
ncbi:hypothetical protein [Rubripirellula tenax]|nr:hypothetical protein [Rubripirellula tenax]